MGFIFEPFASGRCCLCGSADSLTGEHKVKASALRAIFGSEQMAIGEFDGGGSEPRPAQGPKSKEFHYGARICRVCNSSRTQAADREFDRFHRETSKLLTAGNDPIRAFDLDRYSVGSAAYLNVFRYFAKQMCCHLADSGGPRPVPVARFAISETDANPIILEIDADPTYADYAAITGEHQYAAHGGLVAMFNPETELLTSFRTSITLGPLGYRSLIAFGPLVSLSLILFHGSFAKRCEEAYRRSLAEPLPPGLRRKLGY